MCDALGTGWVEVEFVNDVVHVFVKTGHAGGGGCLGVIGGVGLPGFGGYFEDGLACGDNVGGGEGVTFGCGAELSEDEGRIGIGREESFVEVVELDFC